MAKTKRAAIAWTSTSAAEMAGPHAPAEIPAEETRRDSELLDAYSRAVVGVVERTGPAVVSISIGAADRAEEFEPMGAGSGFVIAPDGYVLTNSHVVLDAPRIDVTFMNGDRRKAGLIGLDESTDLAVVCVNASGLPYASLGESAGLRVGQLVIAAGQSLRLPIDGFDRRRLGARPLPPDPAGTADREHHPAHGAAQPGQLGRPAARFARPRHRHQHGHHRHGPGHRLRHPGRHRPLRRLPAHHQGQGHPELSRDRRPAAPPGPPLRPLLSAGQGLRPSRSSRWPPTARRPRPGCTAATSSWPWAARRVSSVDEIFHVLADWPVGKPLAVGFLRGKDLKEIMVTPVEAS